MMASFFTGQGDTGDTGFLGEGRISKTSERIEAVGSVDEATAALGLARSLSKSEKICSIIVHVQKQLYWLMSELSAAPDIAERFDKINQDEIVWLEKQIEHLENTVMLPRAFIIPGESSASAALAFARTIVRRAERRTITLFETGEIQKSLLIAYLNRLSSLIFILEVYEASLSGRGVRLVNEE
jgi:cob(I)alamin adenosyltransferase